MCYNIHGGLISMKKLMKHKNILIFIYALSISFGILLFASKNSFLYPINDWVDANAFFTVGKSMFHGLVPYHDLFEQKGPVLYLIYGIASLISFKSFLGVFILEVLFWTVALYFLYKTLHLFLSTKSSLLILPLFMSIIATTRAFTHGGSAEEFCVPFFFITLYYFLKHFKTEEISKKTMFLNGILAGLVLLIKFSLLGFWFAFTLAIFIDFLLKKDFKKAIGYPLILLLGMFVPFVIFLIYFSLNGAVYDFFHSYFYVNIFSYSEQTIGIFTKISKLFTGFGKALLRNIPSFIFLLVALILLWPLKLSKRGKILLLLSFLITVLGIYFGLKFYRYYLLFILFFSSIGFLTLFALLDKPLTKLNYKFYCPIIVIISALAIFNGYYNANYKENRALPKDAFFQYTFANIINKEEKPTVVSMGNVDSGIYTTTGLYPTTYFFERLNISYETFPDNLDAFKNYIENKETMFIVYFTKLKEDILKEKEQNLYNNYDLISSKSQIYEDKTYYAYLFKVKSNQS